MNLTQSASTALNSFRRARAGLILAAVLLGTSLTACSSPGDTTCGEFKDMTSAERFDVLKNEVDDKGTDAEKEQFNNATDEAKTAAGEAIAAVCDGQDDGTQLDDIS